MVVHNYNLSTGEIGPNMVVHAVRDQHGHKTFLVPEWRCGDENTTHMTVSGGSLRDPSWVLNSHPEIPCLFSKLLLYQGNTNFLSIVS